MDVLKAWLTEAVYPWSPPLHMTSFETPVQMRFFQEASSTHWPWKLSARWNRDLVPREQSDLLQDIAGLPELARIQSADARACISLCRPHGHFVEKRKLSGRGGVVSTQVHQAGSCACGLSHRRRTSFVG